MNALKFFLIALSLALLTKANDWNQINWKSAQILGISSRAGLTPVLVQMGTRSKIDHLGIVSIEEDGTYLYEFTNSTGVQKIPISEFWKRSQDRLGEVHYVIGELQNPLTKEEWQTVKSKLDHWVLHLDPNPPKNCLETLIQSLGTIRTLPIKTVNVSPFIELTFKGKIEKIVKKLYPDYSTFPILSSIFDTLIRVDGNISHALLYPTETSFLNDWKLSGDLSKFIRTLLGNLSEIEIKKESDELINFFEAAPKKVKTSCYHFYIFNSAIVK